MSKQLSDKSKSNRKLLTLPGLERWSSALADILRQPDSMKNGRAFGSSLAELVPSDQWWIIFYREDETPILFDYYDADKRVDNYAKGPYLVCPYYNAFIRGIAPGCYRLKDLAARNPSTFARYTDYYQKPLGPLDEIGLMFPANDRTTALVSLARARSKWKYKAADIDAFKAMLPVTQAVIERICSTALLDEAASSKNRADRHNRVLSIFTEFGRDVLTEREVEINRLLLKGFTAKELARILNITEGTTRIHMKHIYAKLEVSSQAELCGVLIEQLLQSS